MEEEELAEFSSLSDDAGEISKHDLIVQTKKSSFWKGNLDLKSKPSGHSTKVCWEHWILTETNSETFFRDQIFQNRDLFSETNFSEIETFFRDQIFSKSKPRLFFWNQIFQNQIRDF